MRADLQKQLIVPQDIANTNLTSDLVLWSEVQLILCFVELTVPWGGDTVEKACGS